MLSISKLFIASFIFLSLAFSQISFSFKSGLGIEWPRNPQYITLNYDWPDYPQNIAVGTGIGIYLPIKPLKESGIMFEPFFGYLSYKIVTDDFDDDWYDEDI